jgi:hypothetical protein
MDMSSPRKLSPHEWAEIQADHRLVHLLESDRIVDHIAALRQEHEEDQGVIRVWRGRAERAETERDKAKALAEKYHDQRDAALLPTQGSTGSEQVKLDRREALGLVEMYCSKFCAPDGLEIDRHTERCLDARVAILRLAAQAQNYEQEHALRVTRQTDADAANAAKEVAIRERATALRHVRALVEAVSTLLALPFAIEEATIPSAGIDAAPDQVVGTLHVSLAKIRKLKEILAQIGGT